MCWRVTPRLPAFVHVQSQTGRLPAVRSYSSLAMLVLSITCPCLGRSEVRPCSAAIAPNNLLTASHKQSALVLRLSKILTGNCKRTHCSLMSKPGINDLRHALDPLWHMADPYRSRYTF